MKISQINQLVQNIIDTIFNTIVGVAKDFKKFLEETVLKVEVSNPVKEVKVEGKVEVTNNKPIINAIKGVGLAIQGLKKPIMSKKKVEVENFKDLKFPAYPKPPAFPREIKISNPQKEVEITNLQDFVDAVERVGEFVAKIKYDPRIEVNPEIKVPAPVVNIPEGKPPVVNVEAPDLSDIKKLLDYWGNLGARNPMPVRLSDGNKFYKALDKMGEIFAGSNFSAFQTSNGSDARALLNGNKELRVTTSETWVINDVEEPTANLTYKGEQTLDGTWRLVKITTSTTTTSFRYATVKNNPNMETYETAWSNRASLSYEYASGVI